ncbi:MAG: hypothetical protein Q8927_05575 [Bacteroidota bacterium]|nr:hypothetical protein [Bacteroidota bacterium]MDP4215652.1 hypothetical protein [Bacteroidota bacterium]MDP4246531.1 hypothetical protein [Bacteroidota bacterium]MDP4252918.1 hypothetical protein [Bacteroidota bacterium]
MKQPREKDKRIKKEENRPTLKPDPETAGKSDPQEHMKGPPHLFDGQKGGGSDGRSRDQKGA